MRRLPAVVVVAVGVALVALLWGHVDRTTAKHSDHVARQYPLYSASACAKTVVFTWYDMPSASGYEPILCGGAPPSDTGTWGQNLPEPSDGVAPAAPAKKAAVVSRAPASGCPANYCSPNPNPPVPSQRTGAP